MSLGRSYASGLYPATVQQLLRAEQQHPQSSFFLDGIKFDMVTCVADIVAIHKYDTMTVYFLEDGSVGRLRVVLSRSLGSETKTLLEESLREHVYIRVKGRLKVFNHINELVATHIRLVLDMHEPFFHCLEAMVAFVSNQRIPPALPAQLTTPEVWRSPQSMRRRIDADGGTEDYLTAQESGSDTTLGEIDRLTLVDHRPEKDMSEPEFVQQPSIPQESPPPSLSHTDILLETNHRPSLQQDPYSSLSPLQRDIIIRIHDNALYFPDGVPIDAMYRRVGPSTIRESEIRQAIEDMMDEGLLYSTIDQNHFLMVD